MFVVWEWKNVIVNSLITFFPFSFLTPSTFQIRFSQTFQADHTLGIMQFRQKLMYSWGHSMALHSWLQVREGGSTYGRSNHNWVLQWCQCPPAAPGPCPGCALAILPLHIWIAYVAFGSASALASPAAQSACKNHSANRQHAQEELYGGGLTFTQN